MTQKHLPLVSVVMVNFRGADDTLVAIDGLRKMDWPDDKLEIIVVENGSGDDSLATLQSAGPGVTIIESPENLGFAGGCNLGVTHSTGEYVAFLNNDARPDSNWVRAAIAAFDSSRKIGAVASKVLDWEGKRIDFVGAAMTWFGMGYKPLTGDEVPNLRSERHDVLFGTGSAMFVRRDVFAELGGFDENYFMFFEDVDLGWRLNLAGYRFVYEPSSVAFHKHHASMASFGRHKEQVLLERNALFTLFKNASDDTLRDALPAAILLSTRRSMTLSDEDSQRFDLRSGEHNEPVQEIRADALVTTLAVDQFISALPWLRDARARIQSERRRSEAAMFRLFGEYDASVIHAEQFLSGYSEIVSTFDVTSPPVGPSVVIITGDPIGAKIAGPAIRAWNMARELAPHGEVTLITTSGPPKITADIFDVVHVKPGDERGFARYGRDADIVIFQGHALAQFSSLRSTSSLLVADIYDPMHLEQLEQARELTPEVWRSQVASATEVLNEQLSRADFFLCASERQRHFYLGQLAALGRVNPDTYGDDPDLRKLIDVVPFGLDARSPEHVRDAVKGVVPGIARDDKLLLWSGGLYNWFDPLTLIEAVAEVSARRGGGVHLFFQGTKHPHPGVPEMEVVAQSRALAEHLGVLGTAVHFNDSWVDYDDRQNYLTEADAGVSTHHAHIETVYSFRTRILDYLWAGIPMVVTEGDHFAELIRAEGLGIAVPAQSVSALADAIEKTLFDEEFAAEVRQNIARVRVDYQWERVLEPLVRFVNDPQPSGDRPPASAGRRARRRQRNTGGRPRLIRSTWVYLKIGGPRLVWRKVISRLRRNRA